jgi:nucleotide-binding universal stress UspA family protein
MAVAVAIAVWVLIGVVVAVVMIRKGHSPLIWSCLVLYGPLAGLLALTARQAEQDVVAVEVLSEGVPGPGEVDVVVGVDGSPDSHHAAERAVALLGSRLRTIVLATVLDYDITQLPDPSRPRQEAADALAAVAGELRARFGVQAETVVLSGTPAETLVDHAHQRQAHLVAVGSKGHGVSHLILGSTAGHLVQSDVPVLVVHHPRHR